MNEPLIEHLDVTDTKVYYRREQLFDPMFHTLTADQRALSLLPIRTVKQPQEIREGWLADEKKRGRMDSNPLLPEPLRPII